MADVRALLRQQRAARRIEHPHAAYSEAGKLLCTLCREQVRAESHWEAHIQSQAHKQRVQPGSSGSAAVEDENNKSESAVYEEDEGGSRMETQKRKHGGVEDDEDTEMDADTAARRKRSRPDTVDQTSGKDVASRAPPSLLRRKSTTPSHGVEIQIPSRPTTPARRESSSSSTPGGGGGNGVPTTTSLPSRQASTLGTMASNAHPISANSSTAHPETSTSTTTSTSTAATATAAPPAAAVDESEWAAFEADIAAASVPYDEDAVISRTAMTAEESAAAKEAAAQEADGELDRKAKVDVDIEDEREEAKRALEEEFDEMQELEARVQKLKEKREALRKRSESHGQDSGGPSKPTQTMVAGKENVQTAIEEDDEEDDEDTDDWDGFRFRTA